jgi:hypothetical protein
MGSGAPAACLTAALVAIFAAGPGYAETKPARDAAYLKVSYGLALGRCRGTLVLHPDGRFNASTYFSDKEYERSGKTDPIYWEMAMDTLKDYRAKEIQSIDAYYFTVPPDAPDFEDRMAELEAKTDYIILDGHTHTLDWVDEDGDRVFLHDARHWSKPMWQRLLRDVRLEKMTCGHYLQQMFFPE